MTQERKDELFDSMIQMLCERADGDQELFDLLSGELGMTKDEAHDCSIESLDELYDEVDGRTSLRQKLQANLREYKESWKQLAPSELIARAEQIHAMQLMTKLVPTAASPEDIAFLLQFKNPLDVVSDEWISRGGVSDVRTEEMVGEMLWAITNTGDTIMDYPMEPLPMTEGRNIGPDQNHRAIPHKMDRDCR